MDIRLLSTGFALCILFPYINSLGNYWEEFSLLRNFITDPDSEFIITTASSLYVCMSQCTMTAGCCFISYLTTTSTCTRHSSLMGFRPQNSSSVWYHLQDDGCPCGWYRLDTSCFFIPNKQLTWHDSVTYCQELNSRLAEADTEPKDTFIRELALNKTGLTKFWMGGSDILSDGTWLWNTSGTPMVDYQNWAPDQPDNVKDSDCLCCGKWFQFFWDDCVCTLIAFFVCEKPDM